MAKNIVVFKLYRMPDKSYPDQRFKFSSDTYETYKSLLDIAVAQAEQNISNIHELIIHQRTADNDQDMFKKHMLELEELYKSGDHNVLSIGNDVIFFEPVNPFDSKYTTFTLSGLNADVKYYPAGGVSDNVWNLQQQQIELWEQNLKNIDKHLTKLYDPESPIQWNTEQTILQNMMFTSKQEKYTEQLTDADKQLHALNSGAQFIENMDFVAQLPDIANGYWPRDTRAIHFHASRNPVKILEMIQQMLKEWHQLSALSEQDRMQKTCESCKQFWWNWADTDPRGQGFGSC